MKQSIKDNIRKENGDILFETVEIFAKSSTLLSDR